METIENQRILKALCYLLREIICTKLKYPGNWTCFYDFDDEKYYEFEEFINENKITYICETSYYLSDFSINEKDLIKILNGDNIFEIIFDYRNCYYYYKFLSYEG